MSILTQADLDVIAATMPEHVSYLRDETQKYVANIENKVQWFAVPYCKTSQPDIIPWLIQGLMWFDSCRFDKLWCLPERDLLTVSALKSRVALLAQETLEKAMEKYEEDAGAYLLRHNSIPSVENHPWGREDMAIYQSWLNSTPYTIWQIHELAGKEAKCELENRLLFLVSWESDGKEIAEAACALYAKFMKEWREGVLTAIVEQELKEHKARQEEEQK